MGIPSWQERRRRSAGHAGTDDFRPLEQGSEDRTVIDACRSRVKRRRSLFVSGMATPYTR